MKRRLRLAAALLLAAPLAAHAQGFTLRPPSIGDALRTMDALATRRAPSLDQVFVLPERPGQNQVAWYDFDWQYIDVPPPGGGPGGIRLYYYKNEVAQARRALPAIQSAYARLVDQFHYSPTKRIPYILFATQREFQTQNVFAVTESVLGVTSPEDLKMSVPYFGDHARFVEVSTHEMVHQFTIQKLREAAGGDDISSPIMALPLWFIEGIAEYYTKGAIDTETDLYLRDLVWNPDPRRRYEIVAFGEDRLRSYIHTYKLGQARVAFIAETYGKEKIQSFLENAFLLSEKGRQGPPGSERNFGALVRRVLNEPLEQVDGRWRAWLKRRYYPEYLRSKQDLPQLRELRDFPSEPEDFAASPDGNVLVVRGIDRKRGRARLYLLDARHPKGAVEIAEDARPGMESLHPIEHSVAAVAPGLAVFAAQDGIGDAVYVQPFQHVVKEGRAPRFKLGRRRELRVRPPEGGRFIQVADPAISPDGKELAFVGVARDGQRDVYVVSLKGGGARRLTNDPYAERDLAWSAGGIYLSSDATDHGRTNLFRLDPAGGALTRLTTEPASDRSPFPQADGSVLFSSDRGGKSDLYLFEGGTVRQLTDFTTGLTSPALAPKERGALASTFHGGEFRLVEVPKVAWLESPPVAVPPSRGEVLAIPATDLPEQVSEYEALAPRNWRPEAGFVYGGGGGSSVAGRAAMLFSDMLRDHVVFVDVSVYGSFDYTQGLILYESRAQRIGWTGGAFHFVQQNLDPLDKNVAYYQRDFGLVGALRYPLDRFRRFELELIVGGVERYCPTTISRSEPTLLCNGIHDVDTPPGTVPGSEDDGPHVPAYAGRSDWFGQHGGVTFNVQPAVRFGYDTIRYDFATGPVTGRSLLLEVGGAWLPGRGAVHGFARMDAEQYFQLSGRANLGFRAAAGTTFAPNDKSRLWSRSWWLTSADNLRGFDPLDTITDLTGRHYYVVNAELQIPLDPFLRLFIFDYVEGVAALDFGGVFDHFDTRVLTTASLGACRRTTGSAPDACLDPGAWDSRTLTAVLGVNLLFGPLLLRIHFGHPYDIGGLETPAMTFNDRWVMNMTLRYFFF